MFYNGDVIDNTYQIVNEIGSGGMGIVYLAYHIRLEKFVVLKKIKGKYSNISMLRNEVDILKKLHHPFLPQVYDFFQYNKDIYTVIDYIDGYDLDYYIKNNCQFSEEQIVKWLKQLCEVLDYLHKQSPSIIHSDIKPANIIITGEGNVCLIDFGISLSSDALLKGFSKHYASPEQYENVMHIMCNEQSNVKIDKRTDIYSLGATFYHVMTGVEPNIEDEKQLPLSRYNSGYSDALTLIIDKAMQRDTNKRYQNALQMMNAVKNIKKLDARYKRYVLLQIASSLLAGIMVFSGITMIVQSGRDKNKNEYNSKYSQFINAYKSGNNDKAILYGNEIMNNSAFNSIMNYSTKALILHTVGDCFYDINDYVNSEEYYKNALVFAENENDADIYYRDYAISAVNNNDLENAQQVIDKMTKKFPNSLEIKLVNAQIAFQQNNFIESISILNSCVGSNIDSDTKYTANMLLGDSYKKIDNFQSAISAYQTAKSINDNATVLRKLGTAYLALSDKNQLTDNANLVNAKNCYLQLYNDYYLTVDDGINFAQSYSLSGNFDSAKNVLNRLAENYPSDYRIYMQLAFICNDSGDSQISIYCDKAHSVYKNSSNQIKNDVNQNDIERLKALYNQYCSSAW